MPTVQELLPTGNLFAFETTDDGALWTTDDGALVVFDLVPPREPTEASGLANPAMAARLAKALERDRD